MPDEVVAQLGTDWQMTEFHFVQGLEGSPQVLELVFSNLTHHRRFRFLSPHTVDEVFYLYGSYDITISRGTPRRYKGRAVSVRVDYRQQTYRGKFYAESVEER